MPSRGCQRRLRHADPRPRACRLYPL